jgi:hypothetical protein
MNEGSIKMRCRTIIYVLLLCLFFLAISCQSKGKKEEIYAHRVGDLSDVILTQSSACLSQSKAYTAVWEYTKVTGEDFDSAATHILGPQRAEAMDRFAQNRRIILDFLEKIKDPPESLRTSYEKLLEMVDTYTNLSDLTQKPTGSQEEYETSVYKLYDTLLKKAGELNTLLGK